ncbi:pseudouridine synthase [Liquorilactobacillus cacaonum]|uniref:Pseudouridine synthase n=1 Tax=Liquorilactobacillus cacaonum DSM 21116 TaxID=1423729 RepID=A0A0R2CFS1_9LACO|nr:pseudouridine synthase [Liquorilactobacillus cacaonum]KRM90590.1 ribosomal small subunit pseudouridine synthase A [Liquorilactobacillus cacaonum DSM 21116]
MRLDKFIADTKLVTRTQAKSFIKSGLVSVNKKISSQAKLQVNPELDSIELSGLTLSYQKYIYLMMNKPKGVVSATIDRDSKTVIDLINGFKKNDLFPIGRLDKDTTGLMILTNDGVLAHNVLSPKKHVKKTYRALIAGVVNNDTIEIFKKGIILKNGEVTKPAKLRIIAIDEVKVETYIEIVIFEGKYHQIKRMFGAVSMRVKELQRVKMGNIVLDENIELGKYRELTTEEIQKLRQIEE